MKPVLILGLAAALAIAGPAAANGPRHGHSHGGSHGGGHRPANGDVGMMKTPDGGLSGGTAGVGTARGGRAKAHSDPLAMGGVSSLTGTTLRTDVAGVGGGSAGGGHHRRTY